MTILYINNFIIMSMTSLLKCPQKAIIFAKAKSSKGLNNHCSSLDSQVFNLQAYCKKQNFEVVEEVLLFHDSKKSDDLIKVINNVNGCVSLIIESFDSVIRFQKTLLTLEELRLSGKLSIHFIKENKILDKNSDISKFFTYQMFILMAKSFSNNRSTAIKRGLQMKKDRLNNQKSFVSFCI